MAERGSIRLWDTTAANNDDADPSVNWAEGQLPGTVNNSAREMMATLARDFKDRNGSLTTAGSANAYTLTVNNTWTAYANGQFISFKASFTNTSTATLNVTNADATALGAKAIRGPGDVPLLSRQIVIGGRYHCQYDTAANSAAGAWILLNPSVQSSDAVPFTGLVKVAILGDSRAAVTGSTSGQVSFADYLITHMPTWTGATITNYAVASRTLTTVNAQYATDAGSSPPAAGQIGYLILVYHGQINDRLTLGNSAATSFAQLQQVVAKAEADGWRVIIGTEPPASSVTGGDETVRLAYNALILANYTSPARLVRPDLAFPTTSDTADYVDGIHPVADMARRTAGLIATSINWQPMVTSVGIATRFLGKTGIGIKAQPTYTLEIAGSGASDGYGLISQKDLGSSGQEFWLYPRIGGTAGDYGLYSVTDGAARWTSKANGDFSVKGNFLVGSGAVALETAWTSYTPTITAGSGSFTTTSAVGLHKTIGKTVHVRIRVVITTVGTAAGSIIATLPSAATTQDQLIPGYEVAVTGKMMNGYIAASGSTVSGKFYDNTFSSANGHVYLFQGTYEKA